MKFEDGTHTDTCTLGKGCYTEHYLDWYYIVNPFLDLYKSQNVLIANELYCYDDQDGQYYIICVNQALYLINKRWHLCRLSRRDHQGRWLAISPNRLTKNYHYLSLFRIKIYSFHSQLREKNATLNCKRLLKQRLSLFLDSILHRQMRLGVRILASLMSASQTRSTLICHNILILSQT